MVAAFRGFHEGEACARRAHGRPIDIPLPTRDIDAMNGILRRACHAGVRPGIAFGGVALRGVIDRASRQTQCEEGQGRKAWKRTTHVIRQPVSVP